MLDDSMLHDSALPRSMAKTCSVQISPLHSLLVVSTRPMPSRSSICRHAPLRASAVATTRNTGVCANSRPISAADATERAFLDDSRRASGRAQRRLRMVLAGVASLLVLAVIAGGIALGRRAGLGYRLPLL